MGTTARPNERTTGRCDLGLGGKRSPLLLLLLLLPRWWLGLLLEFGVRGRVVASARPAAAVVVSVVAAAEEEVQTYRQF